MSRITVSQLTVYPVKSLRGISLKSLELTKIGPSRDRQWMVIDKNGKFLTQRVLPHMCLIKTAFEQNTLVLTHIGNSKQNLLSTIEVPQGGANNIKVSVWRDEVIAQDCGDTVSDWLTTALNTECRMVFLPEGLQRNAPDSIDPCKLNFADAYPLLLTSESSLANFNSHLATHIGMNRFRPNIVITGSTPYAEDTWQEVYAGSTRLKISSPCTRCAVPAIDPDTAHKQPEILVALNQHRRFGTETRFGQNAVYSTAGTVTLGDEITVLH